MRVTDLIKALLDQPGDNDVYVSSEGWESLLEDVRGSGRPGVMSTFLKLNETGLNAHMEPSFHPTWLTTFLQHKDCEECLSCRGQAIKHGVQMGLQTFSYETQCHSASIMRNPK